MVETDYTKKPKASELKTDDLTLIWATNTFNDYHDDFKITFRHKNSENEREEER